MSFFFCNFAPSNGIQMKNKATILLCVGVLALATLAGTRVYKMTADRASDQAAVAVKPGIEVLRERGYDVLQGKRVGLVTNPTGVDRQ